MFWSVLALPPVSLPVLPLLAPFSMTTAAEVAAVEADQGPGKERQSSSNDRHIILA